MLPRANLKHREEEETNFLSFMAEEKSVMVVGVDESEHSMFALEWTLDHFFLPFSTHGNGQTPFKLVVVNAKPSSGSFIGIAAMEVLTVIEADLKRVATRVMEGAKAVCLQKSVHDVVIESVEGDARNVLCDAADKHQASILVVGSHGYGAMKRSVLGSVSDYCSHHAHCTVMIVKNPEDKH